MIQRIVVEPGENYELSVGIRTEDFDGEAYVAFFTGDMHTNQTGKTTPVRARNSKWQRFTASYRPGTSRVVYVACYAKGKSGTVFFDNLELRSK